MTRAFRVASEDEILRGEVTDVYFVRTEAILRRYGLDKVRVRAELKVSLPKKYKWAVVTGISEALKLLEGKDVTVYGVREGTVVMDDDPIMLIEGRYVEFCRYETAILGILRHYSSISTKAARIKALAGDKTVLYFGLRALHPAIAPMADAAAYMGGVDGVSGVLSKKVLGIEPKGTMPHSLIIVFGDQVKAWKAFDETVPPDVPRIALADTFYDERIEAVMAAEALGKRLFGVRLDTPKSRRGDMKKIVKEVRWTLDLLGYRHVKIFVSGGINEEQVKELRDLVDGFGVGTAISFPEPIDISMDIVEVFDEERGVWVPKTKRGKLPGAKKLYRCVKCMRTSVVPWSARDPERCGSCGGELEKLTQKLVEGGKLVYRPEPLDEVRRYVLAQVKKLVDAGLF